MRRTLRIIPSLDAETLSAFLLGVIPTTLTLQAYFIHPELFTYFGNIVGWLHYTLPGVFKNNAYPSVEFVVVLPVSLVFSIGFAALSWRYIEKPAPGLRKAFARTKSATGNIPPDAVGEHGFAIAQEAIEEESRPGNRRRTRRSVHQPTLEDC